MVINCVISDLTRNEIDELPFSYGNISDQIKTNPLADYSKDYPMPKEFGKTKTSTIIESKSTRYPCELLWSGLYISAEGNVVYCCIDHQYGNDRIHVDNMSLIEIWNSSIKNERERHISNSFNSEPCKSCAVNKTMIPPPP